MTSTVRAFVAIEIPQPLRAKLQSSLQELRSSLSEDLVRWVRPKNMHLTLKFLGEIEQPQVHSIQEVLDQVSEGFTSFMLEIKGFGSFPNSRRPRVLWVGFRYSSDDLLQLQSEIESRLDKIGFEQDQRNFHPHLTVGRVRKGISVSDTQAVSNWVQAAHLDSIGKFEVDSISLIRSDLKPSGAIYTNLHAARLAP
jgi:2'-5' RNA ligase